MKQRKLHERTGAPAAPAVNIALDNLVKSMYDAAMKLQEIQTSFPTPISRAASWNVGRRLQDADEI